MNDFLHKKRKQKKYIRINLACGRGRYVRRHNLLEFTRTRKKRTSYHVHQCWGASLESTAIDSLKRSGEKTRSRSLGNLWQKRRPRFSFFAKNARFPCFLCTSYLVPGTRYVVKILDFQRSSEYQSSGYQPSWLLVPCELAGLSPFAPPRHPEDWRDSVLLATKYPVDWRDSVLLATRYPVDWRDSVLSATRYPVDWRDSVLLATRYPVDWRDSVHSGLRYPVDWRDSVHSAPRYPVDWRDSVRLATGYPVGWRDSVLLATRYPVDWRDSVHSGPRYPVDWRDSVLLALSYPVDWRDSVLPATRYPENGQDSVLSAPQVPWGLAGLSPFGP